MPHRHPTHGGLLKALLPGRIVEHRPHARARGYTRAWERIREWYLRRHPLCEQCEREGRATAATDVDHILPIRRGGGNEVTNLQALCHSCHSRKTARERE